MSIILNDLALTNTFKISTVRDFELQILCLKIDKFHSANHSSITYGLNANSAFPIILCVVYTHMYTLTPKRKIEQPQSERSIQ